MLNQIRSSMIPSLLAGTVLVWACGGDAGDAPAGEADTGAGEVASPVDASTAGNIAGVVNLTGTPPEMPAIDMSDEPTCAQKYDTPPRAQEVLVSNGNLQNVFVYVREGLEGMTFPTPASPVTIDQDGCRYIPHVNGVQVGQEVAFENSDGLLHNINVTPTENRGFNISQPVDMTTTRTFSTAEVMIPVRCDVHGWMQAYIGVLPHPYYSVSAADGTFDLSTLPPGDYVLEAWHERYGTQTANVTVVTGETAQVTFSFDASATAHVPLGEPIDPHDHGTSPSHATASGAR